MNILHTYLEIFTASLKLGLTSFGGPIAHLGFFREEYVKRRKWLDDAAYADIIALCQFLPGPASSQVGIAIGMIRGGSLGGVISWFGFTIPSVIVLTLFGYIYQYVEIDGAVWISSLKIVAVVVVAHALIGMGKKLTPDRPRIAIAILTAVTLLIFPSTIVQLSAIVIGAIIGFCFYSKKLHPKTKTLHIPIAKWKSISALCILGLLLICLPIIARNSGHILVTLFDIFFRIGSIVFGGGHVVLPLMEQELVSSGLISNTSFLAGYGLTQAVPGPLFTIASYLGTLVNGIIGAIVATIAMFLPSFLLIYGTLPFLASLRENKRFQGVLSGVNATVVGLLIAAFYQPVFTSSILETRDFALALILFAIIYFFKKPAWQVVIYGVLLGEFMNWIL